MLYEVMFHREQPNNNLRFHTDVTRGMGSFEGKLTRLARAFFTPCF